MLDTRSFETALYADAKAAFTEIIEEHGNDLYVIGFYHFGGWDCVMPLFNTHSALRPLQEEASGDDERETKLRLKWNPADFPSLEEYSEYFDASTEEIQKLSGPWDESVEDSVERWNKTLEAMERVLKQLDFDGVFSSGVERNSLTLYIATYDEEYAEGYERVKKINPAPVIAKVREEFEYMIHLEQKWKKEAYAAYFSELEDAE